MKLFFVIVIIIVVVIIFMNTRISISTFADQDKLAGPPMPKYGQLSDLQIWYGRRPFRMRYGYTTYPNYTDRPQLMTTFRCAKEDARQERYDDYLESLTLTPRLSYN